MSKKERPDRDLENLDMDNELCVHSSEQDENEQRMEDRERLYVIREMHLNALNRLFEELSENERIAEMTEGQLRIRKERMQKHFENFENAHTLYRQACMLASDDIYVEVEERFMQVLTKIEERLSELCSNEQGSFSHAEVAANSTTIQQVPTVIRVENPRPPQIGTFNGSPADWPAFRDLFLAEVHNKELDPVTKLLYLQQACVEKAAATLGPWQPTSDNYVAAWEVMMKAYNDDYHVIHGIFGKMFAVKRQERESHESLRSIVDVLTSGTRQLDTIAT